MLKMGECKLEGGGRSHIERETNMTGHSNQHDHERRGGRRNFTRSS
jgi:hypothetical protein